MAPPEKLPPVLLLVIALAFVFTLGFGLGCARPKTSAPARAVGVTHRG